MFYTYISFTYLAIRRFLEKKLKANNVVTAYNKKQLTSDGSNEQLETVTFATYLTWY